MTDSDTATIATRYVEAWTSGDLDGTRALLHDDVRFEGPLATIDGVDDYMVGLEGFSKAVDGAKQHVAFANGDNACVVYDLVMKSGVTVPTAGRFWIRDGRIAAVQVFFDPRPLLES